MDIRGLDKGVGMTENEYTAHLKFEYAKAKAERLDLEIVFPTNNELFIDIDSEEDFDFYQSVKPMLNIQFTVVSEVIKPSQSGGVWKKHITLTLEEEVTETERLLLQACLGSDRKRELLGYFRVRINEPHPTLFFEKKPHTPSDSDEQEVEF